MVEQIKSHIHTNLNIITYSIIESNTNNNLIEIKFWGVVHREHTERQGAECMTFCKVNIVKKHYSAKFKTTLF